MSTITYLRGKDIPLTNTINAEGKILLKLYSSSKTPNYLMRNRGSGVFKFTVCHFGSPEIFVFPGNKTRSLPRFSQNQLIKSA